MLVYLLASKCLCKLCSFLFRKLHLNNTFLCEQNSFIFFRLIVCRNIKINSFDFEMIFKWNYNLKTNRNDLRYIFLRYLWYVSVVVLVVVILSWYNHATWYNLAHFKTMCYCTPFRKTFKTPSKHNFSLVHTSTYFRIKTN